MSQGSVTNGLPRLQKRVALAETVADAIASAISVGHFGPGGKISETELSERLGVSRVPIREALKILDAQGIVTGEQNRGYRVALFDQPTIERVLEVRLMLETILLRDAVHHWRERNDMASELNPAIQAMHDAARRDDRAASLGAVLNFHRAIANAADNEIARVLWEAIARHVLIIFSQREYQEDDLNLVAHQHEALHRVIRAIIKGNMAADDMRTVLEHHLLRVADARKARR